MGVGGEEIGGKGVGGGGQGGPNISGYFEILGILWGLRNQYMGKFAIGLG